MHITKRINRYLTLFSFNNKIHIKINYIKYKCMITLKIKKK